MAPKKSNASNSQSRTVSVTKSKSAPSVKSEPAIDPDLIHQVPGVIVDHVKDSQIITQTFAKEDQALQRLADFQRQATDVEPNRNFYRPNPYNRSNFLLLQILFDFCLINFFIGNHQFVIGKVMTSEPPEGKEDPNKDFLIDTRRTKDQPVNKSILPETSNQEIGWFTKTHPLDPTRTDTRISHPRRYSNISRFMDVWWSYYPPPIAKFHPKDK